MRTWKYFLDKSIINNCGGKICQVFVTKTVLILVSTLSLSGTFHDVNFLSSLKGMSVGQSANNPSRSIWSLLNLWVSFLVIFICLRITNRQFIFEMGASFISLSVNENQKSLNCPTTWPFKWFVINYKSFFHQIFYRCIFLTSTVSW